MRQERSTGLALAAFVLYSLVWWWPTRELPYHWDAAMFVVRAARDLLATGFHPLVVSHTDFAHPPLLMALVALAWKAFGETRLVAHLVIFPFLPLGMAGTYFLGRTVSDRLTGVVAAALFGAVPVVLEEYGEIYMDLPAGAVIAWALFAWMTRRYWLAGALFAVAAMLKLPTLVVPVTLLLTAGRDRRAWMALGLAPALTAVWLVYHHAVLGFWLSRPDRATHETHDVGRFAVNLAISEWRVLLAEWRIVPVLVAGAAWLYARRKGTLSVEAAKPVAPLFLCALVGCAFFAAFGEVMQRYGIFLLPPYLVGCVAIVRMAAPSPIPVVATGVVTFGLFASAWYGPVPTASTAKYDPDQNLGYLDVIHLGQEAARYVEDQDPSAEVYGTIPESYELTEPYQGYVGHPHDFQTCDQFVRHPGKDQLIVRHDWTTAQAGCAKIVADERAHLVARFTAHDKWLEIYRVTAP